MPKFEIVNESDVCAPTSAQDFEAWARAVCQTENDLANRPMPELNFRWARPRRAERYYRTVGVDEFNRWEGKKRITKEWCEAHQDDDQCNGRLQIQIVWGKDATAPRAGSSGVTYWHKAFSKIAVTLGTDDHDRRMVFLHEVAHSTAQEREHHPPAFFRRAFALYRKYGLDMARCAASESRYKPRNAARAARPYLVEGVERIPRNS